MAGNPFFSGRIPKELNDSVVKHCEETGKSKTEVLIAALSSYLNIPIHEQSLNSKSEITKQRFDSLADRVAMLENILLDNSDINNDNKVNQPEEDIKNTDDNSADNSDNNESKSQNYLTDNNHENGDNIGIDELPTYNNINSKKLSEIINTTTVENTNLKAQAFRKAKKYGYEITQEIRYKPPIEMVFKKGITINKCEYKLFCEGTNEKEQPVWTLKPDDNASYQPDILSGTN